MKLKVNLFPAAALVVGIACSCISSGSGSGGASQVDESIRAERMQAFVEAISSRARSYEPESGTPNPGFIVIPQNGIELAFSETDPGEGLRESFIDAIDGVGVEELFYDGSFKPDSEKLSMLRQLKDGAGKPVTVMVSDLVAGSDYASADTPGDEKLRDAITRNDSEGFIAFPRSQANEPYKIIPPRIPAESRENPDDVATLGDAKNYLYLINTENYAGQKNAMLSAISATNYDLVLIDPFFEKIELQKSEIDSLKVKQNGGKRLVIAYLNIGAAEEWRAYWQDGWRVGNPSWIKKVYSAEYPDEYWVEYWETAWQNIIFACLDGIIDAGFDGVYLDNVEAYYFLAND